MFLKKSSSLLLRILEHQRTEILKFRKCHSLFGVKELLQREKVSNFRILQAKSSDHDMAVELIKRHYLSEHIMVRARRMDLNDRALDEYLISMLKQGNTLYAKTEDGEVAGVCINFASSHVDPRNLRLYAYYRQNPNTKDLLCFIAQLQETPNLWEIFKQPKIFEIKMLTVLPEFRRQGLAVLLAEKSKLQALDQGYKVIRMDCINAHDYKVAERCMLQCIVKFPLHKLRGENVPYIKRGSEFNRCVRVYVDARTQADVPDKNFVKHRQMDLDSLIE